MCPFIGEQVIIEGCLQLSLGYTNCLSFFLCIILDVLTRLKFKFKTIRDLFRELTRDNEWVECDVRATLVILKVIYNIYVVSNPRSIVQVLESFFLFLRRKFPEQHEICVDKFMTFPPGILWNINLTLSWGRELVSLFKAIYENTKEETMNVWAKEENIFDIVLGLELNHQPEWADVNYVYNAINIREHWILVVIDVNKG